MLNNAKNKTVKGYVIEKKNRKINDLKDAPFVMWS